MAKRLEDLLKEYGYPVLTPEEARSVQENTINWNSVEGEIVIRKCLRSYPAYLQASNYGYRMTAYHYSLAANLQRDYEKGPNKGQEYGLILLSAPPQTGKSVSITESFQSWVLLREPRKSILTVGYESTFAARFGRRNRDKFGQLAPILSHGKLKLHDKVQSTEGWEIMEFDNITKNWYGTSGGMQTAGIGGPLTGKTGGVIVIDDPIKNMQDADSESKISTNIEWYQSAAETRMLSNKELRPLCIVMCTRWVDNDLIGWLRRNRKKYIVGDYNYAALCTKENQVNDPLGREVGEGICPERGLDGEWAENVKESYMASQGGHVYNALFQGAPTDELGNLFRLDDWGEYDIAKTWIPENFDRIYLSIDATFKDLNTSDYVAMKVGGIKHGNDYARYLVRKHMDLPDTLDKIIYLCKKFPEIDIIYIEDKANGPGIISVLRKWRKKLGISERDFPSIVAIEPNGGKYSRAQAAAPYQREGRCYLPYENQYSKFSSPDDFEWDEGEAGEINYVYCFKHELGTFPFAAHDDLVDAHTQAIIKCIPLITGEEAPEKRIQRFVRYSKWWPEMWADYRSLREQKDRDAFIKLYGAPMEWRPRDEGGEYGVI